MRTILVSGASGIVGYGILRSLRQSNASLRLIGTTIYDDSVAQAFCDVFEQAPLTDDFGYLDWLIKVIKKYRVDLIIPGIEVDMYKWTGFIPEIQKHGATLLLNSTELISLCRDKWVFYQYLLDLDLAYIIQSSLNSSFEELVQTLGLPFLIKPRRGFGSKGIVVVKDEESFSKYSQQMGRILMAQQIVGNMDEEYTTSAFCDGDGGFYCYMTLIRKLSKEGFTDKAQVVHVDEIHDALTSLCEIFKPIGPTNFQFRKHNGVLKLLEINPRISSATSIRAAFGYNESVMAVEFFLDNVKPSQPVIRAGKAVRYVEDYIIYL